MDPLLYDDVLRLMKECEPPWQYCRGRFKLHVTPWLRVSMPVVMLEGLVLIQEQAYRLLRDHMAADPFGPPNDDELAAMLAHAIFESEKNRSRATSAYLADLRNLS